MGPRPRGRGIVNTGVDKFAPLMLQWGRDRAVAELEMTGPTVVSVPLRFNGAATARSRNWHQLKQPYRLLTCFNGAATARSRNYGNRIDQLPLLRRFNGAATARSRNSRFLITRPVKFRASMGPRPRGRGMVDPILSLQWGRDRAVAEFPAWWLSKSRGNRASMGPRPRGRGIFCAEDGSPAFPIASMGPRPRGRGIKELHW